MSGLFFVINNKSAMINSKQADHVQCDYFALSTKLFSRRLFSLAATRSLLVCAIIH